MQSRIQVDDDKLFPVQAFFNAIPDRYFVEFINTLSKGVGANFNEVTCTFPGDLDPGELGFEGVRFSIFDEEVVLSIERFKHFLTLACEVYLKGSPQDEIEIRQALQRIAMTNP